MRLEADGKGSTVVFTGSGRLLVHTLLFLGWQVDPSYNEPEDFRIKTVIMNIISSLSGVFCLALNMYACTTAV